VRGNLSVEGGDIGDNVKSGRSPWRRHLHTPEAVAWLQVQENLGLAPRTHGLCKYSFFEQCPHRMACARCEFYVPKQSAEAGLLEAKANLQRMLVHIPLTDDERAAVEDDNAAVTRLLTRLADVATPAGPTPRELGAALAVAIPVRPADRTDDR
jgi:hypothetical protein